MNTSPSNAQRAPWKRNDALWLQEGHTRAPLHALALVSTKQLTPDVGADYVIPIVSADGVNVALVYQEEYAALILAAPDLLAALVALIPYVPGGIDGDEDGRPWLKQANDAIAKATGAA